MEGSRHEKVLIILAAYVIGFVTAYLLFTDFDMGPQPAAIIMANDISSIQMKDASVEVSVTNSGLVITREGDAQLLSANKTANKTSVAADEPVNGFHVSILGAAVSPNEDFVYFCEQLTAESTVCEPFVYSFNTATAHRVRVDGEAVRIPLTDHNASWSEESRLVVDEFSSVSTDRPWLLE